MPIHTKHSCLYIQNTHLVASKVTYTVHICFPFQSLFWACSHFRYKSNMKRCRNSSSSSSHDSSSIKQRRWLRLMVTKRKRGLRCYYQLFPFYWGRKHVCFVPLQLWELCLNRLKLYLYVLLYMDWSTFYISFSNACEHWFLCFCFVVGKFS